MQILGFIVFGLIVGAIARLVTPGRGPGGLLVTAVIGMAGALVGGLIGRYALGRPDSDLPGWILSILGAVIVLVLHRLFSRPAA